MRIENLRAENSDNRARVAATIVWEDCDRAPQEVYYETTHEFGQYLACDPHAFLTGSLLPAIRCGERRIAVDEPICPELRTGLAAATAWLKQWSLLEGSIQIETRGDIRYPQNGRTRAGAFLSGGVDSLAILHCNRADFPPDHPSSIRDALFVHGFDMGGLEGTDDELTSYELALDALRPVAQDAGVNLIPVRTNVRHLLDDVQFWIYQFHGAALASVAHAFSGRLSCVSIASDRSIADLRDKSTHPLLEPNFSSANLRVNLAGLLYSRLDRVRLISDWQVALDSLRVCTMNPPGKLNCGECEKCLRTMLQLLAVDSLDKTSVFPYQDVLPEMLERLRLTDEHLDVWYGELIDPLTARGRLDLVEVIERKRSELRKHLAWQEERDWKGAVKRFDRKWLGGMLFETYKTARMRRGDPTPSAS
ncbi:MAG: hypothetical protein GX620_08080 [Chloroflexi bacterium]|nr:hypothetical protein [Chloroflexota bacterium]